MAFDIGAGIAQAGTDVAKLAGAGALEEQKAAAEQAKITLMDQLATVRETAGRQQTHDLGMIAQKDKQTYESGEKVLDRSSREKEANIHAGATLGAAREAGSAHRDAAKTTADAAERMNTYHWDSLKDINTAHDDNRLEVQHLKAAAAEAKRGSGLPSPELLDIYSDMKIMNGEYPEIGYGGKDIKLAIDEDVAKKAKAQGITTQQLLESKTIAKSAQTPLVALQKVANIAAGQAQTAHDSANMIIDLIEKDRKTLGPTGVPLMDRYIQGGRKAVGDENVKELDSLINSFMTETSKVISGNTGGAGVAVTLDTNLQKRLNDADNDATLRGVLNIYDLENKNRMKNYARNISALTKQRVTGQAVPVDTRETTTPAPTMTKSNPTGAFQLPADEKDMVNGRPYALDDGTVRTWDSSIRGFSTIIPPPRQP